MTTLDNLIGRMNAYTPIYNMDQVRKVNALDQAIRMFRVNNQPPWTMKKTTIRLFSGVLQYPIASDQAQLAFIDNQLGTDQSFFSHPRYVYTSLKDFYEDPTYRNSIAEIWENGTKTLGIRDKTSQNMTSSIVNSAESVSGWTGTGDAGTPVLDEVFFITGTASIRVPITNASNTATVSTTFTAFSDSEYLRKYHFRWIYLDGLPTSLKLRVGTDSSNYLESGTITTQFSGAPFVENDWNLVAFDLNTATTVGSFSGSFAYQAVVFTAAPTGNYYFDDSYLKGWILQDYWYYSTYNVLNGSTYQEYFAPDNATYNINASLIGDTAWHDCMMYEACLYLLSDQKEQAIFSQVEVLKNQSWAKFFGRYPDLSPYVQTNTYRFGTDYGAEMGYSYTNILG